MLMLAVAVVLVATGRQVFAGNCMEITGKGTDYTGTIAVTVTGAVCNLWSAQSKYTNFASDGGIANAKNYCRNPGAMDKQPWCYTGTTWEYCTIPYCRHDCIEVGSRGYEYSGTVATTISGLICQAWASQSPQKHTITNSPMDGSIQNAKNYCRNPDNSEPQVWCYTVNGPRWEYCYAPYCKHDCLTTVKGQEYTGTISVTTDGYTCQAWASQTPNSHPQTNFATDGGIANAKNYCRNPDGSAQPWCYTTNGPRWQYCNIPACGATTPSPPASVTFTLVVDDAINGVFADGVKISGQVTTQLVNVGTFSIPSTTGQISIQGRNNPGKCGIIGSDASGKFITGGTWRCSNTFVAGWSDPGFDDSAWPLASATPQSSPSYTWLPQALGSQTVQSSAQFIWTASCTENQDVYCNSQ